MCVWHLKSFLVWILGWFVVVLFSTYMRCDKWQLNSLFQVRVDQGSRWDLGCHTGQVRVVVQSQVWCHQTDFTSHTCRYRTVGEYFCEFVLCQMGDCTAFHWETGWTLTPLTREEGRSGRALMTIWTRPREPFAEVWEKGRVLRRVSWKGFSLHSFPSWLFKWFTLSVGWVYNAAHTCLHAHCYYFIGLVWEGSLLSFPPFFFPFKIYIIVILFTHSWSTSLNIRSPFNRTSGSSFSQVHSEHVSLSKRRGRSSAQRRGLGSRHFRYDELTKTLETEHWLTHQLGKFWDPVILLDRFWTLVKTIFLK